MPTNLEERKRITAIFSGTCTQKKLCPVKDIMAHYGDKWTMHTVLLLGQHQRMRFSELRTGIRDISQRMLTVRLRSLEQDGLVFRTTYPEIPPRVEYQLTELGESLFRQLLQLAVWADDHVDAILKARKQYEKKQAQ